MPSAMWPEAELGLAHQLRKKFETARLKRDTYINRGNSGVTGATAVSRSDWPRSLKLCVLPQLTLVEGESSDGRVTRARWCAWNCPVMPRVSRFAWAN